MALKMSTTIRNAEMDAIETAIGVSAKLVMWDGDVPDTITVEDTGHALVIMNLPADYLTQSLNGSKAINGTWSGHAALSGTVTYFRIYENDGTTQHIQGTVGAQSSGMDMELVQSSTAIVSGQLVSIGTFTLTAGNAS